MFVDESLDHVKVTGDRGLVEQLVSWRDPRRG